MSKTVKTRTGGFTLVELLVVIGIIAVLTAMLMPVMRKVRMAANSVQCMSNLRQLGIGYQMYSMSFRYVLPHDADGMEWHQNWFFRRAMGIAHKDATAGASNVNGVWPGTLLCPDAGGGNAANGPNAITGRSVQRRESIASAYGMNHENTRRPQNYTPYHNKYYLLTKVNRPETKLLLMDAPTWSCTMNQRSQYQYDGYWILNGSLAGANAYRHGLQKPQKDQLISILFFDFHVDQRRRAQITGSDNQWLYWK